MGQAWKTWAQYGGAQHSSVIVRFPCFYRWARYFRIVLRPRFPKPVFKQFEKSACTAINCISWVKGEYKLLCYELHFLVANVSEVITCYYEMIRIVLRIAFPGCLHK